MRFRLHVAVVVALLVAAPAVSAAAGSLVAEDAPRNATAWNTQRKVVRAEDGTLFATVLSAGDDGARVRVLTSTDDGASWRRLPDFTDGANETIRSTLALGDNGELWLAWTEYLADEGHHEVFVARFDGDAWRDRVRLSHTTGYSGYPSLAVDDAGRVHVAWYGLDVDTYQVFYRVRGLDGAWSKADRLTVGTPDAVNPALALGPDGRVHVAWYKQEKPVWRVYYAVRDADGWSAPRDLSGEERHAKNPTIAVSPQGVAFIAWDETDASGKRRVWFTARVGVGVDQVVHAPRIVTAAGENASFPSMSITPGGDALLAWAGDDGLALQWPPDDVPFARVPPAGARDPSLAWDRRGALPNGTLGLILFTAPAGDGFEVRIGRVTDDGVEEMGAGDGSRVLPANGAAAAALAFAACALVVGVRSRGARHK